MPRLIKRYANRKLYDTASSTYIALDDIERMVRQGEELRIIDNETGEDLTGSTLAHIVLEQQKVNPSFPLSMLRGIIQSGEEFFARLQSPVTQFREEFRRRAEVFEGGGKTIRDFIDGTQHSIDDLQHRLDEHFSDGIEHLAPIAEMRQEIRDLQEHLIRLEERLSRLEEKP